MEHWYVYYKVPVADTPAVANRVRAMFNAVGASGAKGRLMQRAEPESDEVTLMEIYEPVHDARAFEQLLAQDPHVVHTVVTNTQLFSSPLALERGDIVQHGGCWALDVNLPC